jgi:hypothetical protein
MPLGHCVVAEAGCNWYLHDNNIYSLLKIKNMSGKVCVPTKFLSLLANNTRILARGKFVGFGRLRHVGAGWSALYAGGRWIVDP